MSSLVTERTTGRSLVGDDLFTSLADFLIDEGQHDRPDAERVMDQALAFLGTLAGHTGEPLMPSDAVDPGWHAFILHTRDYSEWTRRTAGRYLHHHPRPGAGGRPLASVKATVEAMRAAGYAVDEELWTVDGQSATQCDSDDGRDY